MFHLSLWQLKPGLMLPPIGAIKGGVHPEEGEHGYNVGMGYKSEVHVFENIDKLLNCIMQFWKIQMWSIIEQATHGTRVSCSSLLTAEWNGS